MSKTRGEPINERLTDGQPISAMMSSGLFVVLAAIATLFSWKNSQPCSRKSQLTVSTRGLDKLTPSSGLIHGKVAEP